MSDDVSDAVRGLLQKATRDAEALQDRLEAGEIVSDEEMTNIARGVAEAIEAANAKLRELIGPVDTALMREKIVEDMTPEEFEQWSRDNAELQEFRAQNQGEANGG